MKRILFAFMLTVASAGDALAANYFGQSTKQLIDELTKATGSTVGISDGSNFSGFLADDSAPYFSYGLLPVPEPAIDPAMRELVRRGAAALPALLAHLDDKRPTETRVGTDVPEWETFGGQFFSDEYDARDLSAKSNDCTIDLKCRSFEHPYTVKVGDVCEVLIGQIVNRRLSAARYQPSALVYVNSPIETPSLAQRIRGDWAGLDAKAHEASLLSDLRTESELDDWHGYGDALKRLRFYYPKTYAGLTGDDLVKRKAFEAEEAKRKAEDSDK